MDAKHHLKVGKCEDMPPPPYPYRRRRQAEDLDAEFNALVAEIDEGFTGKGKYGAMASPSQLSKLEVWLHFCRLTFNSFCVMLIII